eukprot:3870576-Prymnesium_polylepis.2
MRHERQVVEAGDRSEVAQPSLTQGGRAVVAAHEVRAEPAAVLAMALGLAVGGAAQHRLHAEGGGAPPRQHLNARPAGARRSRVVGQQHGLAVEVPRVEAEQQLRRRVRLGPCCRATRERRPRRGAVG